MSKSLGFSKHSINSDGHIFFCVGQASDDFKIKATLSIISWNGFGLWTKNSPWNSPHKNNFCAIWSNIV
jgi:hypothetical protein